MSWIKEVNKLGRYETTYQGFRIYWLTDASFTDRVERREDGLYRVTYFHKGKLVAVDKTGLRIYDTSLEGIAVKIEKENLKRYYDKRDNQNPAAG